LRWTPFLCAAGYCLLLSACADNPVQTSDAYVVLPKDTLYSIAWRFNLDYHDLAKWNHIGSDYRITVGQTLLLSPRAGDAGTPKAVPAARAAAHAAAPATTPRTTVPEAGNVSPSSWVWPTMRYGPPRPVPGGGILIAGIVGQDVRAASSGRVVYSGSGIRGYGNLIIIKHSEALLSAYAHNRESLVREGEEVAQGQVIGHMGEGAPAKPVLYFEIRRNGKPIDPLPYLPK
jgi:lipoprotein NlpD